MRLPPDEQANPPSVRVICPLPKRPLGPRPSPLSRDLNDIVTAVRQEKFVLGQMVTVGDRGVITAARGVVAVSTPHIMQSRAPGRRYKL